MVDVEDDGRRRGSSSCSRPTAPTRRAGQTPSARWPRHLAANAGAHAGFAPRRSRSTARSTPGRWTRRAAALRAHRAAATAPLASSSAARAAGVRPPGLAAACVARRAGRRRARPHEPAPQPTQPSTDDPAVTAALDGASEFTPSLDAASADAAAHARHPARSSRSSLNVFIVGAFVGVFFAQRSACRRRPGPRPNA